MKFGNWFLVLLCGVLLKSITTKKVEDCIKHTSISGVINCGTEKFIKAVDLASDLNEIEILPGISIKSNASTGSRNPKKFHEKFALPQNPEKNFDRLIDLFINVTNKFLTGRSIQIKLSNTTVARALEEGRGRMKKMGSWMFGMGVTALTMVPMVMSALTSLTLKSLLVGKLALLVSVIMFIQYFSSTTTNVLPGYGYGHSILGPTYGVPSYPYGVNNLGGWS